MADSASDISGAPPPATDIRSVHSACSDTRPTSSASCSSDGTLLGGHRIQVNEEHAELLERLPAMSASPSNALKLVPVAAGSLQDDYAALIGRLEAGVKQRDSLMKQERERHRSELRMLQQRLSNAEEREAETHNELLLAKQDQVALAAANRQLEELQRSNAASADKLTSLSEAESLNQQKHTLLLDALDAERKRRAGTEDELEGARREIASLREELRRCRDDLSRTAEERSAGGAELEAERTRLVEMGARAGQLDAQYRAFVAQKEAEDRQRAAAERQRVQLQQSQAAARAATLLTRNEKAWAWGMWSSAYWREREQSHKKAIVVRVFSQWLQRPLLHAFIHWRHVRHLIRRLARKAQVIANFRKHFMSDCWKVWSLHMRAAVRHDRGVLIAQTAELRAVLGPEGVPLEELHGAIRELETLRREERARLEAEVSALSDALRAQHEGYERLHEQCERLRRSNARVLAQFEAAEIEFLDAERLRADAPPSTVVGRIVEAVFGPENRPEHNEAVRAVFDLGGRGDSADRLAVVAAGSTHHHIGVQRTHHSTGTGRSHSRSRQRGSGSALTPSRRAAKPPRSHVTKPTAKPLPPEHQHHQIQNVQSMEREGRREGAEARALVQRARARAEREVLESHGHSFRPLASPWDSDAESTATGAW